MDSHVDHTMDELAVLIHDRSMSRRDRAEYAIEFLARLAEQPPATAWGKAQAVLLGLLNDYDDAIAELRQAKYREAER